MKQLVNTVLVIGLCLLLTACGFHMRGADSAGIDADRIYLDTRGGGQTGNDVQEQMQLLDVELTETAKKAEYVIRINNERFNEEVLTVSPATGKIEEYELFLKANLSINTADGESLISNETLSASRDQLADPTAKLSSSDEKNLLREEMTQQIASLIMLRVRVVIDNHKKQPAATAAAD